MLFIKHITVVMFVGYSYFVQKWTWDGCVSTSEILLWIRTKYYVRENEGGGRKSFERSIFKILEF